jgi:hypothetical protein
VNDRIIGPKLHGAVVAIGIAERDGPVYNEIVRIECEGGSMRAAAIVPPLTSVSPKTRASSWVSVFAARSSPFISTSWLLPIAYPQKYTDW